MNFKPQTEQEIIESKLWPKADYDFEIVDAFDKTSKTSGKPMIELKLKLSRTGSTRIISDYLLVETPEKLLHAATAQIYAFEAQSVVFGAGSGSRLRISCGSEKIANEGGQ